VKVKKLSVEDLWGKYTFSIDFNEQISVLIGKNGSGKSTVLHLLDSLLSSNKKNKKYKFKKISLELDENIYQTIEQRSIDISKEINELEEITEESIKTLLDRMQEDILQQIEEKDNKKVIPISKAKEEIPKDINYLFISTFDMEMKNKELLQEHYGNSEVKTELDIFLSKLIMKFKLYQLDLKEKIEKVQQDFDSKLEEYARDEDLNLLKDKFLEKKEKIDFIYKDRDIFKNKLNELFSDTGKSIKLDENNSIIFNINEKESVTPYQLSSGEKQLLIILLNVLLLENKPTIVLMDEPEISLHVEWQMVLIETLLDINPNLQLIITTHSPSLVSKGYRNNVISLKHFNTKKN